MGRRRPLAGLVLGGCVLAGGLGGCGGGAATQDALDVTLDGFHPAAVRPTPEVLCDPEPTTPAVVPPALPDGLGSPDSAYLESAPTTLEAYAWTAEDADTARALVAEATASAAACAWTGQNGDQQQADPWSTADWAGLRVVHSVPGTEQVDRRLVARGEVVLLVVTRTDRDDPASLAPADDYLAAVAQRLG